MPGCQVLACLLVVVGAADAMVVDKRGLSGWLDDFKDTVGDDPLFARLVSQIWSVHEEGVHENATMLGMDIDPINMDDNMGPMDIPVKQELPLGGFVESKATLKGIEVHGLSSMYMDRSSMQRKEQMEDLNMNVTMRFDNIFINGSYRVESMGFEVVRENHFSVGMSKCWCSYEMHMALLDMFVPQGRGAENKCTKGNEPDVQLLELGIPLDCLALDFNFIGAVDWLVETLGLTVIKQILIFATNFARDQINWLLCASQ